MFIYYRYIIILIVMLFTSHVHQAMNNGVYVTLNGGIGVTQEDNQKVNSIFSDFKKNHIPSQELINRLLECFSSVEALQNNYRIANIGLGWQLSPNVVVEGYPIIYQKQNRWGSPQWNCGITVAAKIIMPFPFLESIRIYEKIGRALIVHTTSSLKEFDWAGMQKKYSSFSALYDQFMQSENAYWFLATGLKIELSSTKTLDISWERHPHDKNKVAHFIKIGLDWHI